MSRKHLESYSAAVRAAVASMVLALLATSLLAAPAEPAAPAAPSDRCAALTAGVVLGEIKMAGPTMKTEGHWTPAPGTDAALFEILIDGDRYSSRTLYGKGGTWSYDVTFPRTLDMYCGRHVFEAAVFPAYKDGGELIHCFRRRASKITTYEVDCASVAKIDSCDLHCAGDGKDSGKDSVNICKGICTGSVAGGYGLPPFQPLWGDGKSFAYGEIGIGPFEREITCVAGSTVTLKLRERSGFGRISSAATWVCGAPAQDADARPEYHPGEASTGRLELKLYRSRPDRSPAATPAG